MSTRWQDWTSVLLGCWLAVSPAQLGYSLDHIASGNACGVGVMIVLFNIIAVGRVVDAGQEIVNVMVGFWLIMSPYALDFAMERSPALNAIFVGAAIIILAGWQMINEASKSGKQSSR